MGYGEPHIRSRENARLKSVRRSSNGYPQLDKKAGKIFDGTVFKGNTVQVERLSPSGKWAYGMVYGHVNRHDWIDASILTKKK
jgi:hypothetical protein